jgi:Family of unknown function (DUF6065)/Cupin-like domain
MHLVRTPNYAPTPSSIRTTSLALFEGSFMDRPRLDVEIYQISDDRVFKKNRSDGTGWDWCWADWQREWMNATPHRYAYRCLPLTIVNQTGWWIKNPVGFTVVWNGRREPANMLFQFDSSPDLWGQWINSQFGEGVITWNTPFLFRTKPEGSRLLVCGPANYFKTNAHPLTALIESDWISMSFTMNWKIMTPNQPVRFELGEPLFQAIPMVSNVCADLEDATVTYQALADNPELHRAYMEWDQGRRKFHEQKATGEVKGTDWQKDYFQGRDATGQEAPSYHMTKIKPPAVSGWTFTEPAPASGQAAPSQSASSGNGRGEGAPVERPGKPAPERPVAQAAAPNTKAGRGAQSDPLAYQFQTYISTATLESIDDVEDEEYDDETEVADEPVMSRPAAGATSGASRAVDDEWRRWIAENLLLALPPESILDAMVKSGFDPQDSTREINKAIESPYLKGAELLHNRLKKRDWLVTVYRKSNRLHPSSAGLERRHKLSRDEFLREYYSTNRPVIITGMMDDWPAMQKWNLDYFAADFGDRDVEVQMGRTAGANYETEREKFARKIKFGDFVERVRAAGRTNDFYLTANNNSANRQALAGLWDDVIQIPEYLTSNPPGGFFWMGPPGTITPFHHDLTNNFMAQVIGRKRLKIAPSWDMPLMQNHLHCFSRVDGGVTPPAPRPPLDEPQILEFILNPGEILFLPIGCLHYVEGVDISVTMSFTNFIFDNDFSSFYQSFGPV